MTTANENPTVADDESGLNEKPLEFFMAIANTGGWHDGQAVLPEGDHYRVFCTCGEWEVQASSQEDGLRQARIHTGSISE
ncbi:hypothetical protein [Nocardia pseudovaccinii]|uniref:hypothetical protein n=1 Tax=Nocardia pseudovaccinii TaxID=189540 RepID=UPI0007A38AE8|nr:hypothetical protein [Nocardia pseudovaccinii]